MTIPERRLGALFAALVVGAVAGAAGGELPPALVANLNQTPVEVGSQVYSLLRVGAKVVLGGTTSTETGLWATDGTAASTEPLLVFGRSQICFDSTIAMLAATPSFLFLRVEDCGGYSALWFTDGTVAGTRQLRRFRSWVSRFGGEPKLNPETGQLFFSAADSAGAEPWVSDGTVTGTRRLADLLPSASSNPILFTPAEDLTYFAAQGEGGSTDLWVSDGSEAGTHKVRSFAPVSFGPVLGPMIGLGRKLLFAVSSDEEGAEPWISDGTSAGTMQLASLAPGPEPSIDPDQIFVPFADRVAFAVSGGSTPGLWITNGTPGGTRRLLAVPAGEFLSLDSRSAQFLAGKLFFTRGPGHDLWVSDGQPAGTRSLGGIPFSGFLGVSGGRLLFLGGDDTRGTELWRTDGTPSGTSPLGDFCAGACPSSPQGGFRLGNRLILSMEDAQGVRRVYRSDGTAAGTVPIATLEPGELLQSAVPAPSGELLVLTNRASGPTFWSVSVDASDFTPAESFAEAEDRSSAPRGQVLFGDQLLFWAHDRQVGSQPRLFALDEPQGVPQPLTPIVNGNVGPLLVVGDRVFFQVEDQAHKLMASDGTVAGTGPVFTSTGVDLCGPFALGSEVAFFVERHLSAWDLWFSGGTAATTRQVAAQVGPTRCTEAAAQLGGRLYFRGSDGDLWRTDGTAAGTMMVKDLEEITSQFGHLMAVSGDRLFFTEKGPQGTRLWASDGTTAGTIDLTTAGPFPDQLFELAPFAGGVVFAAPDPGSSNFNFEPWVSDGTPAGTQRLKDIHAGLNSSSPFQLFTVEDRVYFSADDFDHGRELWVTDGTSTGTRLVVDLATEGLSSAPHLLTSQGSRLIFSADSPSFGRELWVTDGAAVTTRRLTDLQPGSYSSAVDMAVFFGDQLLFAGDDGALGTELWRLPAPGALDTCTPPQDLCLHNGRIRVRVGWRDPRSGNSGVGTALPFSTQSGFFWFFNPANVELVVKVLDGGPVNGHWWSFYGALSDVEYWVEVTDLETGRTESYRNPPRNICGVGDTTSLPKGASQEGASLRLSAAAGQPEPRAATGLCSPSAGTLCLLDGRFAVSVDWRNFRTGETGAGTALPGTEQSGSFWFFNPGNLELVVKMLDGTAANGHFWFFYGALSDVEYTLRVTDTVSGEEKTYANPARNICGRGDTTAFSAP